MRPKQSFVLKLILGALMAAGLFWAFDKPDAASVVGVYTRTQFGVFETLSLSQTFDFRQTLVFPDKTELTSSGKWTLEQWAVKLDGDYLYWIDDDSGKLLSPPKHVSAINFLVKSRQLCRELQAPLVKAE
jgi:hypothetical protein